MSKSSIPLIPQALHQPPPLALLSQKFDDSEIADIPGTVRAEVARLGVLDAVKPGQSVAITAGSRGIHGIRDILSTLCTLFRERGATPFLFPAMGSHGGATAEGQTALLASYGIDAAGIGAPVCASMKTVHLGDTPEGIPVHSDALACEADHIVVVNRVKAHTRYKDTLESGLIKMMGIGMGKHKGAALLHRLATRHGIGHTLRAAGRMVLEKTPVLMGLGIVENAFSRAHTIRGFVPAELEKGEEKLLELAKNLSPKLPFSEVDLLIVDEMGKNISGTGMDTNVTGRCTDIFFDFHAPTSVRRLFVRGLTEETKGNAMGVGYADFVTDRLVEQMDYAATITNALTGISPEKGVIPIHFPTDRHCIEAALHTLGDWHPDSVRVVRIVNTLRLTRIMASPALLENLPGHVGILSEPQPLSFDESGGLPPFPEA